MLIALTEEFDLLPSVFGELCPIANEEFGADDYAFEVTSDAGLQYRCITFFIGDMDTDQAAHATNRLMKWKPGLLVNLGIAASMKTTDVKLGDVFVAKSVDRYATKGKVTDSEREAADAWNLEWGGAALPTHSEFVKLAEQLRYSYRDAHAEWQAAAAADLEALGVSHEEQVRLREHKVLRAAPAVVAGPLASGPFVQASPRFIAKLHERDRNLKACEMEAGGMLLAAHERKYPTPTMVLRGISDLGDAKVPELTKARLDAIGDGALRKYAMGNSIRLFRALLRAGRLPRVGNVPARDEPRTVVAFGGSADDLVPGDELLRYAKKIEAEHARVQLIGFQTNARLSLLLDDLYVPLDAIIDRGGRGRDVHGSAEIAEKAKLDDALLRQEPLALAHAFTRARELGRRSLVLLGDPGSGKTTHLKRVLLKVVREGPESLGLPSGTVPVFLSLQTLRDREAGLPGLIHQQLQDPSLAMAADFGQRLCRRGKLLLLLDGLDEVAHTEERALVARWIEAADRGMPDSYMLVTCRYAGYTKDVELDDVFLELHLRPLDDTQMQTFVRNWYGLVHRELLADAEQAAIRAREKAEDLLEVLTEPEFTAVARVYEMTRNPLLLTAICLVHLDQGRLPNARAKLYQETITVLLARWQHRRRGFAMSPADALDILQPLAAWMHTERERRRASRQELLGPVGDALARLRGNTIDPNDFLAEIRDESGLLTGWGVDEFGFMHLGLQEFLTAQHLRNEGSVNHRVFDDLAGRFDDPWWQEVILLLLAQRNPSVFEPFFRAVCRQPSFVTWASSEMMQLCLREAASPSSAPFAELLGLSAESTDPETLMLGVTAAKLLERAMPEEFEVLLRDRWNEKLRHHLIPGRMLPNDEIEFVRIPAGKFIMGSQLEDGDNDEHPQHEVELDSFCLARTPVTNAQYSRFLEANPGAAKPEYWADRRYNRPDQPVVGVSWEDACAFCAWAGLVLPTEAQWEYACRAGTTTKYWSGDLKADLTRVGWYQENSGSRLHAVGEKEANPWGLYDMHGNVYEWCRDRFGSYLTSPRPGDGLRHEPVGDDYRVMRGGCWSYTAGDARSAFRDRDRPSSRTANVGFRPAGL